MQTKTTRMYNYIPLGRLKLKRLTIPSAGENVEHLELSGTAEGMQNGAATLEHSWQLLIKQNIQLEKNPIISLVSMYPKETKTCSQKVLHVNVHRSSIYKSQILEKHK